MLSILDFNLRQWRIGNGSDVIRIEIHFGYTVETGLAGWGRGLETMIEDDKWWQPELQDLQQESRKWKDRWKNIGKAGLLLKNKKGREKNAWQYFEDRDEESWGSLCLVTSIFFMKLGLII